MGLLQRLFGATRDAITLPNFDGSKAVNISATMLRECIDRGSAGPDGPRRARLAEPFARGYLFGFPTPVFNDLECLTNWNHWRSSRGAWQAFWPANRLATGS